MTDNPRPSNAVTTQSYWENEWENHAVPDPINPLVTAPENHFFIVLNKIFTDMFAPTTGGARTLIEIGCGSSRWLPYFHQQFGFDVSGIDYTVSGTARAREILQRAKVPGDIRHGDLFEPPPDWIEHFDVVVSFGLVEHFSNTSEVVSACARYLRPGGYMFSLVPTMRGLYGACYRLLRPEIYKMHIPHTKASLADAHARASLRVTQSEYLLGMPGIISPPSKATFQARVAYGLSRVYWHAERSGWGVPPNRLTSPYSYCIARK